VTVSTKYPGLVFTLVGPGGAGKNALMNAVLGRIADLRQLPTATTRPIRPMETDGREHLFVTTEEFHRMARDNELLEWQEVHPGRFYGIPRSTVENALHNGEYLIADIEIIGADILRRTFPANIILIFIAPPSMQILEDRMRARGENEEEITKRMNRAQIEMPFKEKCDYVIINDEMESAVDQLYDIILKVREREIEKH
jgi:guanylate kinase